MATLTKTKIGFQDQLWLNAGQKYCRMLQGEHSAILSTFIKLPFVINTFVFFIFEWLFYTGFIVHAYANFKWLMYVFTISDPDRGVLSFGTDCIGANFLSPNTR